MSEVDFSNVRHIRAPFDVRNEMQLPKFGVHFATNVRHAPLANAPNSKFLIFRVFKSLDGQCYRKAWMQLDHAMWTTA